MWQSAAVLKPRILRMVTQLAEKNSAMVLNVGPTDACHRTREQAIRCEDIPQCG